MKRRRLRIRKWGATTQSKMGMSNIPDDIDFSDCEGYGC